MRLFVQDGFIYIVLEHSEKDVIERAVLMGDFCDDGPRFWCPTRLYHSTVSGIRARYYRFLYEKVLEKK